MQSLFEWLLVQLKIKCWGVALEKDIPAEFVVSAHARKRFRERVGDNLTNDGIRKLTIRIYFNGRKLTPEEARASDDVPRGLVDIQYRLWYGYVYVFGTKPRGEYSHKYLVTIYKSHLKQYA